MNVDLELSATVLIGGGSAGNQYAKITVAYRGVDPDAPVPPQLERGQEALQQMFGALLEQLRSGVRTVQRKRSPSEDAGSM